MDMTTLANNINTYIGGGYDIKDVMSKQEINYIKDNMSTSSDSLYRLEENDWTAKNLKIGSTFTFNQDMKSFTRSSNFIGQALDEAEDWGGYQTPVVFQTSGKTLSFNVTPYAESMYKPQQESWVSGKYKVKKISTKTIAGHKIKVIEISQISK